MKTDAQDQQKPRVKRKLKSATVVSGFLKQEYGIGWRDISGKLRSALLADVERVACNLCGQDDPIEIATRDKFDLHLTSVMCRKCGLIYLNPRPTAATYQTFYEQGGAADSVYHRKIDFGDVDTLLRIYYGPDFAMTPSSRDAMQDYMRKQAVEVDGSPITTDEEPIETMVASSERKVDYYASHIYEEVKRFVPRGGKVFEPGASAGKMLWPWKKLHDCEVGGVEPKKEAVLEAKREYDIELIAGFADDPRVPQDTYDLVMNTRTINHMLDPLGDLRRAWSCLKADGVLLVDIQDATRETRYEGFERNVVEIDHPYMFSLSTLSAMVQRAGFIIVERKVVDLQSVRDWDTRAPQQKQIRIVARKTIEPPVIDWPDPLTELAGLLGAQLEFDRKLSAREQLVAERKRKRKQRERTKKPRLVERIKRLFRQNSKPRDMDTRV